MAYEHQLLPLAHRLKQLLPLVRSKLPVVLTALGQSQVSRFLSCSPVVTYLCLTHTKGRMGFSQELQVLKVT